MNHTYRLVWSEAARCYVPAPETARGRGKSKSRKALAPVAAILGAALSLPAFAQTVAPDALPSGGQVVHGQASISQSGSQMTVQQGSDKAILNWNNFDIGRDASVHFQQHKNSDIALNRVIAGGASQIEGKLSANGQVWLVNPNGVVFGNGSQVDVGGLVASTLNILDKDFLDGKAVFTRDGATGGIVNQGTITAKEGGYIAMLAPTVSNDGVLVAKLGTVAMAAGDKVTLEAGVNGLLQVEVESATLDTLVENKQLIVADGGQVVMTGKAANALASSVVANTGTVQARTLQEREGRILLLADMDSGTTQVSGILDASAPNGGDGGFIETSAARVKVAEGARVTTRAADGKGKTGTWLIDPTDFTISAGGAAQTGSGIGADTLSANLNDNNISLETAAADTGSEAGDINVDADVGWNAGTTLTLTAHNDVNINASINAGNGGSLTINAAGAVSASGNVSVDGTFTLQSGNWTQNGALPAFSANDFRIANGASFLRAVGGDGSTASPYQIADVYGLQGMASASLRIRSSALTGDIDASGTAGWNSGAGFVPIGSPSGVFTGNFDGGNHVISGLTIHRPSEDFVGLFGFAQSATTIENVGLTNSSVTGQSYVGGLVGYSDGNIRRSYATGGVSGQYYVGGLVGMQNSNGTINSSYATGSVMGQFFVGGLVGSNSGSIGGSYAAGDTNTVGAGGGLVGSNSGSIDGSYAAGDTNTVGTGDYLGGLAGYNEGSISNSYAAGAASGNMGVGGLVGYHGGSIIDSYALGQATGADNVGGLVGYRAGSISGGLWNNEVNANAIGNSPGELADFGKTLAQLRQLSTFAELGWDIDDAGGTGKTWRIYDGHTTPLLRHFLTAVTLNATPDYDGSGAALSNIASVSADMSGVDAGHLFGSVEVSSGDTLTLTSMAAGEYTATSNASINGGLYSDQQGYDISYGNVVSRTIATGGTAAGDIHLANPVTWLNGTLLINTTGTVTALGAISGGAGSTFRLVNGTWVQNAGGGTLPGFSVQNFQLSNPSVAFLRVRDGDGSAANPYQIGDVYGLQGMASASLLGRSFALTGNIDASGTAAWNSGAGFVPIGGLAANFTGSFDGRNHVISGLTIHRPSEDFVGLFGYVQGATIQDVGLENGSVTGFSDVGGLAGRSATGSRITNSYNKGQVDGTAIVGGLVGHNWGGDITDSYATGAVTGSSDNVGGLVGHNVSSSTITGSYATGSVIGRNAVGGLAGSNNGGIDSSYATGNVSLSGTGESAGGLVGRNNARISNSYATGEVSGLQNVGGLVGLLDGHGIGNITGSYALGEASGLAFVGGLVGRMRSGTTVSGSLWNNEANAVGVGSDPGAFPGTGRTLAQLRQLSTFTELGWDIDGAGGTGKTWRIYDGHTTPLLRRFLTAVTIDATPDYDGSGMALSNIASVSADTSGVDASHIFGSVVASGGDTLTLSSTAAGGYTATSNASSINGGLYSDQQGYDISYGSVVSRTIATSGTALGDIQLTNPITWLNGTLAIDTAGVVTATGAISGGAGSTFKLVSGTWVQNAGGGALPGFSVQDFQLANTGATFLRVRDGDGGSAAPYRIGDVYGLQGMASSSLLGNNFALAADIDASGTTSWNHGAGFAPIGKSGGAFTGSFNGGNYIIGGLTIYRPSEDLVGLFGLAQGATIQNVGLAGGSVIGFSHVGGLIGRNETGSSILNSYNTGVVAGSRFIGGLVGRNNGGILGSYATGAVTGTREYIGVGTNEVIGGLVGYNSGAIQFSHASGNVKVNGNSTQGGGLAGYNAVGATITDSHASGDVTAGASTFIGGLVGDNAGSIQYSYASGSAIGSAFVGGLAGRNSSSIDSSYATGNATGDTSEGVGSSVGGLVGTDASGASIGNSYAAGAASGYMSVGGLVGSSNGSISGSYALGAATGSGYVGGLVGFRNGSATVINSLWNNEANANGVGNLPGELAGFGRTLAQLRQLSTFANLGWDIDGVGGTGKLWRIYDGHTTPLLRHFLTAVTLDARPDYDGSGAALSNIASVSADTSGVDASRIFGSVVASGGDTLTLRSTAAGGYTATSNASSINGGLYSDQQGYDISYGSVVSRTIATSGTALGDIQLTNPVTWINGTLAIDTAGTVTATGAISGGAGSTFRLVNGTWAQHAGGGALPGFSVQDFQLANTSATFLRVLDGDGGSAAPYQIADVYGLQGMASSSLLGSSFVLANDIDASGTAGWNSGAGFSSIGKSGAAFTGSFDGGNYAISGLTIHRPTEDYVGLFGFTRNATIQNVGLENGSVVGDRYVGGLAGYSDMGGSILNSYNTGVVAGVVYVGGLVGENNGSISASHASGNVNVSGNGAYGGGLVGLNATDATVVDSHASGGVTAGAFSDFGSINLGGLVGGNAGSIQYSYATGNVTGHLYIGGLAGLNGGSIDSSYATGSAAGDTSISGVGSYVGGLVGTNASGASIGNSYATGAASGHMFVGGLVGSLDGSIADSYATGAATGSNFLGGLVGTRSSGSISDSLWNNEANANGVGNVPGELVDFGRTLAQLRQLSTFIELGWDIDDKGGTGKTWRIYDGHTTPLLRRFLTAVTIDATPDYDGSGAALANIASVSVDTSGVDASHLFGSVGGSSSDTLTLRSTAAGEYTATSTALLNGGLYSDQQGYDISYGTATRTIATSGTAAGDIDLTNPITWSNGTLAIDTTGTVTATGAISGGAGSTFRLVNGTWAQHAGGGALPGFSVQDFQLSNTSATFLRVLDGDGGSVNPFLIADVYGLQGMASSSLLGSSFMLANDIAASGTAGWNSGAGFIPIGNASEAFEGSLDGDDYVISGLTINRPSEDLVGLFGLTQGATIQYVGLENGSVIGYRYVGGLAGSSELNSVVIDTYNTGAVNGTHSVGGLVGRNDGIIAAGYAMGNVGVSGGGTFGGGLVGYNTGDGIIILSYASGMTAGVIGVDGSNYLGGLAGGSAGVIQYSYATGSVMGQSDIGGLVGSNSGSIDQSYATGVVGGRQSVGGLVGSFSGSIADSYAIGAVTGNEYVGGLIGSMIYGDITGSYAIGTATGSAYVGGLAGYVGGGSIDRSLWNNETNASGVGNVPDELVDFGRTLAQLRQLSTFTDLGWDIDDEGGTGKTWRIYDGHTTPLLRGFLAGATVNVAINASKTYDATAGSGTLASSDYTVTPDCGCSIDMSLILGSLAYATSGANAGSYALADGSLQLSGLYSGQQGYDISYAGTADYTIDKAALIITSSDVTKTYDGTTSANGTAVAAAGYQLFGDDSLSGGSFAFDDKNAGTDKTVSVSGVTVDDGNNGGNYDVSYVANTSSTIDKLAITGAITADNKTYDGTTVATTHGSLDGVLEGDDLSISGTNGSFEDKHAGTGKTVNVAGTVAGADVGNYEVVFNDATTADIAKLSIAGTITADGKTYDGTTAATTQGSLSGVLADDDLSVASTSGSFEDRNAGTSKAVSVAGTVAGADAGNYEVTFNEITTADIAKLAISGSITADNKTYDGTTAATTHGSLSGVLADDDLSVASTSGSFEDKHASVGKTVNVAGTVAGADAGNYEVVFNDTAIADIAKLSIAGTITADGKTYDGTTSATTHGSLSGVLVGDDVAVTSTNGSFEDKNAGTGKTVDVAGAVAGADADNYDVVFNSTTTADISKLAITGTITAEGKTYDGTTEAITQGSLIGVLTDDDLSVASTSGSFEDKNAGTGKTVNVEGTVAGADVGNYEVVFNDTTTADIAKLAITGAITADNKTYDGTTAATTHGSLSGVLADDDLSVASTSGSFEDKNAGTGKAVSVAGTVAGVDAGNYEVTFNDTTTADIAKLSISGSITADNKTYDGTTAATTHGSLSGVIAGDDLAISGTNGSFGDKNVGTGKTVNVGGTVAGADAANYEVTFNDTTTADIAKLAIVGTITAEHKVYDGTTSATTHGSLNGVLAGDDLSISGTNGSFSDKNAGTSKAVTVEGTVAGADAGNYEVVFNDATTANIAKLAISGTITADNKTYDGITSVVTQGSLSGVIAGDDLTATTTGSFEDKNAGTGKTVNVAGTVAGADVGNYEVAFNDVTTADIAKLAITGTVTADNKTYDGTTVATTHGHLVGVLAGDDLTATTSGSFEDKNASTGKTVNVAGTVIGADAGNYEVVFNDTTTADIAKLAITGVITADNKTYDGTTAATTQGSLTGVLADDDLSVASTSGSFEDRNAGTSKAVSVAGTVAGVDAGNYEVTFNDTTTADIAKLAITGTITADNKTYDGTTNATTHGSLSGVIAGDDLSISGTNGSFGDKNAGTSKTVAVVGTVAGADADNYDVAFNSTTTADISKLAITGTITADNRTYDGTTNATTHGSLTGVIAGDDLTAEAAGSFEDKNAGSGKTVNVAGTLVGADAGNYDVEFNSTTTADIAKLAITGAITADGKTYDGTTSATTHGSLNGVLAGDDVSIASTSGSFEDKNAGGNKTVNVAGAVAGSDSGNYDVTFNDATTADITKLAISGSITADNKTYDGTTAATTQGSLIGVLADDDLSVASTHGSFEDKNAGTGKTVSVAGTVAGVDAGNYEVTFNDSTTADIAKLVITGTITADGKVYDGTTAATTQGILIGVLAGDDLIATATGSFEDKNAGIGKTVNVAGTAVGSDAGNYEVAFNETTIADIAKLAIVGTITAEDKVYDGTTSATTHGSLNGVLTGDDLSIASSSGSFEDKNAGTGKTVNVAGTVAGADVGNYEVAFNDVTTADIAKLAITGSVTADNKTYDGTTVATTHGHLVGVLAGDDLTATTSGSFEDKNASTGKTVNVAGTVVGADVGNYDVVFNDTTTADIAKLSISGAITADNKTYDGTTAATTQGSLTGVLADDDLSVASTSGSFEDKNAGTGKTVSVAGTVAGSDVGNYEVTFNDTTTADIAKLAITGTITADNKTYDGTTNATTYGSLTGVIAGDDLTAEAIGSFEDKHAGSGKTVNVAGALVGADAGNYDVEFNSTTTADIAKLAITGAITADDKVYDGTTVATTQGSLTGVLADDDLSVASTSGSFEDKNAGTSKIVNVSGTVSGTDAGNYDVVFNDATTADIAKLAITGAITADNKTYDGTTAAMTHGSLSGVIAGDDLAISGTNGSFGDKNAGTSKTVAVAGTVAGTDADNYDVAFNSTTTADISKLAISGAILADGKVYDGTTSATTYGSLNGVIAGDDVSVASTSGSFEDKNAGSNKTVSVAGVVAGADAGNYDVVFNDVTTADVAKLAIVGTVTADNKTYDGTTVATTHGSLNGVIAGDDLTAVTTGSFEDKNAGSGKTVNVAGNVAGADVGNYEVTFNDTTLADIAKLAITGAITADNKIYDGTTVATTQGSLTGVLADDDLSVASTSGSFEDKNAGTSKIVNVSGTVSGADAGNYDVVFNDATTADIAKLAITGTITADNRTYDGTTNATTHGSLTGVIAGDDLTAEATGSFEDKHAGSGKTVNVAGTVSGVDAGNYEVTFNDTTTADIAKLAIAGTITADGKTYDGTTSVTTHGSLNGVLAGDDLSVASTSGSFEDKNAGSNKTVNVAGAVAGADSGNYDVTFNDATTADIAKLAITGVIVADNKTYDGTTVATTQGSLTGVLADDDLSVASTSGSFEDKNAGTGKTVSVAGIVAGADAGNYEVVFNDATTADIAKLAIAGTITADGKTYDGTTGATTHGSLSGVLAGDDLSVASTSGSFEDKNAGSGKTVNVGGVVTGADASNYDVAFNSTTTADIGKLAISGSITADGKTYDGTTNATTHGSLAGVIAGDDLSISGTNGSFEDKNAGTGKTVNVAGTVVGADAGNYEVVFNDATTADIAKLAITGTITADDKVYDGTTSATTHGSLSGVLTGDDLSIFGTNGSFGDKNAGTGKTVNVAGTVVGSDAGNYDVVFNDTTTADIAKLAISGTIIADNKTYDGTTVATTQGSLTGVLADDDLSIASTSGSFEDKNAGTGKTVSVAGVVAGADSGNYEVAFNDTTTADIAKLGITGVITADGRVYDGTINATTHGSLNGVIAGDDLTATTSGSFEDKNAGTGKTVNVVGTVAGADAGNYEVAFNDVATADIAKLAITGAITAENKTYDGTTAATTQGSLNGVIAGDDLIAATTGSFEDKNAGTGKTVIVAGTVTGADTGNYEVVFNDTTTADIAKLAIAGTITADNKTYDGTINAITHGSLNGVIAGDDLTATTTGSFEDKNAGMGKTVNVVGAVAGADADNYDVAFNSTTTADISRLAIAGVITADNKTYDGTTSAATHGSLSGVLTGDDLSISGTNGSFSDKNAGANKTVNVAGTVVGADAGNYEVVFNDATTADIAKLAITGAITADGKVYDGATNATTHGSLTGVIAGDDLTATTTGSFEDKNAGTGKTINVAGIVAGADAGNYDVAFNSTATADISKLAINGVITADGKVYDGTTSATTHGSLHGVLAGDDLSIASSNGSFSDKNAGTGKTVSVTGIVAGADAGNYDVIFNSTTTADIAKLAITGTIMADGKVYDGTTVATAHGSLTGVIAGDDLTATATGSFEDKNAGTGKTVNVAGVVAGADVGNYDVAFNSTTTADIGKLAISGSITADGKTYDGTTSAITHGNLNGVIAGDDLTATTMGSFEDKNAGTGKTVNVAGTIVGADSGNYEVAFNDATTADIAKLAITGIITADGKVYDGTTSAMTHGSLNGVLAGDDLSIASSSGSFNDKNAGTSKTVNVAGTVEGADVGNYDVAFNDTTTADIAKLAIAGSITADDRVYDGTTNAITHGSLSGVIEGDDLVAMTVGSFGDKNAGTGKTVNVSGIVAGADAGNYEVAFNDTATATIDKAALTITANDAWKTAGNELAFLGTEFTTGQGQLQNGETVTSVQLASDGSPASAPAGDYAITANHALGAHGFDESNYDIAYLDGMLTVVASPAPTPTPTVAVLSGESLWRELAPSLEPAGSQSPPSEQDGEGQTKSKEIPQLTLAPGYIRLDE